MREKIMQSLANLALRQIPIDQAWEELKEGRALPAAQIQQLRNKITLDTLYHEGLINGNIDPDLFAVAVEKSIPNLVWPYIAFALNHPIYYPVSPFSQSGEDYMERDHGIDLDYFTEVRQGALSILATELASFLKEPDVPHDYNNLTIVWGRAENPNDPEPLWKVLAIRLSPEPEDEEEAGQEGEFGVPDPVLVNFFTTLDEMMVFIFHEMESYSEVSTLISTGNQGLNNLEPDYQAALRGIRTGLQAGTEDTWEMLKEGIITLTNDFQLALAELENRTRLVVMGNHLYIIVVERDKDIFNQDIERGNYYLFYRRDDALLILSSLYLTGNYWTLDINPVYEDQGYLPRMEETLSNEEIN